MHFPCIPIRVALALGLCATLALQACDTKTPEGEAKPPEGAVEAPGSETTASDGEAKVRASDCSACHAVDEKLVGPSYVDIARRYSAEGQAVVPKLVKKIKEGGSGSWGDVPMTPHPQLSDADLTAMVQWILSLDPGEKDSTDAGDAGDAEARVGKMHRYKTADGKTVQTDFAVFTGPDQEQVTEALFHGFLQYNSYCFRCHGGDAVGGELAPDLRKSLAKGMTYQEFLSVSMAGREEKGMPAWAGFFEKKDIRAIYEYVKARQLGLVAAGRPPSVYD